MSQTLKSGFWESKDRLHYCLDYSNEIRDYFLEVFVEIAKLIEVILHGARAAFKIASTET